MYPYDNIVENLAHQLAKRLSHWDRGKMTKRFNKHPGDGHTLTIGEPLTNNENPRQPHHRADQDQPKCIQFIPKQQE